MALAGVRKDRATMSTVVVLLTHGLFFQQLPLHTPLLIAALTGYLVGLPIGWKVWTFYLTRAHSYRTAPAHRLTERIFCASAWGGFVGSIFALVAHSAYPT